MTQSNENSSPVRIHHRLLIFRFIFFLLVLVSFGIWYRLHFLTGPSVTTSPTVVVADTAKTPDSSIELGVFIDNIYAFQAENKTFDANGWVWLKWSAPIQKRLLANRVGIEKLIHLANQTDSWDFALEPDSPQAVQQADGRFYQRFKFSGHFYVDYLDLKKFPFHTIKIPLIFELQDTNSLLRDMPVGLLVDRKDSGIGAFIDINGYVAKGFELHTLLHEYTSRMGEDEAVHPVTTSPQVRIDVQYDVMVATSFLKLILPLVTIMCLALLAPSMSSNAWEARVGVPPTILLTLIFLQQSYRDKLPELTYMTFMDSVYNICYVVNLILFVLFLWSSNELEDVEAANRAAMIKYIDKIDNRFQAGLIVFIIVSSIFDWYSIVGIDG